MSTLSQRVDSCLLGSILVTLTAALSLAAKIVTGETSDGTRFGGCHWNMDIYEAGCSGDAWGFCRLLFCLGDIATYAVFYSVFGWIEEVELLRGADFYEEVGCQDFWKSSQPLNNR